MLPLRLPLLVYMYCAAITILGGKVRLRPSLMLRATSTVVSVFFLTYYTQTKILALQEKGQM